MSGGEGALPVSALSVDVTHEPRSPGADATAGSRRLRSFRGIEIGVWEMTPGTMSDVETDEVFVVVAGRASIRFIDPRRQTLEIAVGDVVSLSAGMQTEWTVTETLRKVYLV